MSMGMSIIKTASFILIVAIYLFNGSANSNEIGDKISKIIADKFCYIENLDSEKCMEPNDQTSRFTADLYLILKNSPPSILKSFSKVNQIYLVKDFTLADTTAYFSAITESIYFSEADFLTTIRNHDDEIFFSTYAAITDYIKVDFSFISNDNLPGKFNYSFATIFYHELAHFIEYSTLSMRAFGCLDFNVFSKTILYEIDLSEGRDCERKIIETTSDITFKWLNKSDYASLYAVCTHGEDFAETYAKYLLTETLKVNFTIKKANKPMFDLKQRMSHKNMQAKINIVKGMMKINDMTKDELELLELNRLTCSGIFE